MTALVIGLAVLSAALSAGVVRLLISLRRSKNENQRLRDIVSISSRCGESELEELRRLRHDMRHYLLSGAGPEMPSGGGVLPRSSLEALVEHYRAQAEAAGGQADLMLDLVGCGDEMVPDLCLVVSNLLENAVECLRREGGGWLRARCVCAEGYVSLVVGNSSAGQLHRAAGGFLSSKARGRTGMGLASVEETARRRGGQAVFTADGKQFLASVFLPCPVSPAKTPDSAPAGSLPTPLERGARA